MANNRKGLGRGLGSLLNGESYEEHINNDIESSVDEKVKETLENDVLIRKTNNNNNPNNEANAKSNTNKENTRKNSKNIVVEEVEISEVYPNPDQPRSHFDEEELEQLSASIKKNGLLQPISVTEQSDGTYEIIAGERRWKACNKAGMKTIPVIIKKVNKDKKLELALIENLQRSDLNPIEEAYCYRKIIDTQKIDQNELANKLSKGRSTITNSLRLLTLPENAQKLLYDNQITAGHARAILSVGSEVGQQKLTEKILKDNLSVREAENLANLYSGRASKALTTRKPPAPKSYKRVTKALTNLFGSRVRVKKTKNGNKIEIAFKDEKDLERLYNLIVEKNQ